MCIYKYGLLNSCAYSVTHSTHELNMTKKKDITQTTPMLTHGDPVFKNIVYSFILQYYCIPTQPICQKLMISILLVTFSRYFVLTLLKLLLC